MNPRLKLLTIAGIVTLAGTIEHGVAADSGTAEPQRPTAERPVVGSRIESDTYSDYRALILAFRERRREFLEARWQLRHDLAAATSAEERRQLLQAFADDYRDVIVQQRELRREFRDLHRDIRRRRRVLGM